MAPTDHPVTLTLPRQDLGQLMDGIEVLIDQWEATRQYHETGEAPEGVLIREASDADEAAWAIGRYREILGRLREAVRDQAAPQV